MYAVRKIVCVPQILLIQITDLHLGDLHSCNKHGTIYAISSDFGDRMTTQSMGLMVLLSEHF